MWRNQDSTAISNNKSECQCWNGKWHIAALYWCNNNLFIQWRYRRKLEQLWNELAKTHPFVLYCGYPLGCFADEAHRQRFREICDAHDCVLPADMYAVLPDADLRLREIAELQQRISKRLYPMPPTLAKNVIDRQYRLHEVVFAQGEVVRRRVDLQSLAVKPYPKAV